MRRDLFPRGHDELVAAPAGAKQLYRQARQVTAEHGYLEGSPSHHAGRALTLALYAERLERELAALYDELEENAL
jgi:hypothetical protein